MSNILLLIISATLMYSAPLIFASLGGVISERSGVINIGIEGMMTIGAFASTITCLFTQNPWLGFLAGGLAGGLLALLHAAASVYLKADQTVSGVALNLIGPGLSFFLCGLLFDGKTTTASLENKLPKVFGSNNPVANFMGDLNFDVTVIIAILFTVLVWFILYKTKWGLRIRAVGEHPTAADTLGINVFKVRSACVISSGILAGFGGAAVTLAIISQFGPTAICGQGFIALAAVIFGKWKPQNTYLACIFFGFAQSLAIMFGGPGSFLPSTLLSAVPYLLTLIVLVLFVGHSKAPKANGIAYEKGSR